MIQNAPAGYREWVAQQTEDLPIEDEVLLYCRSSLQERNETLQVKTYLPDYLLIGDDSGGRGFVLRETPESPIWIVDMGSLQVEDFQEIATSFSSWRSAGFSLPPEPQGSLPLHADIYVDGAQDLKTMFSIKKLLSVDWQAGQSKDLLQNQPFLAVKSGPVNKIARRIEKNLSLSPYVFYEDGKRLKKVLP